MVIGKSREGLTGYRLSLSPLMLLDTMCQALCPVLSTSSLISPLQALLLFPYFRLLTESWRADLLKDTRSEPYIGLCTDSEGEPRATNDITAPGDKRLSPTRH